MNVLLVYPPAFNIIRESLPPVVEDSTGNFPPIGLLYVAAYAESVPDCRVQVLDCQAEGIDYDNLAVRIADFEPDVVGVQVMTFTLIDSVKVAQTVRSVSPDAFIVFGGPHPTLFPNETVNLNEVDAIVYGEGEYPFKTLLENLKENKKAENAGQAFN